MGMQASGNLRRAARNDCPPGRKGRRTMRKRIRPAYAAVATVGILVGALGSWSVEAFAGSTNGPAFTVTPSVSGADFAIPKNSRATWTLNLWSHGHLLGTQTATSG